MSNGNTPEPILDLEEIEISWENDDGTKSRANLWVPKDKEKRNIRALINAVELLGDSPTMTHKTTVTRSSALASILIDRVTKAVTKRREDMELVDWRELASDVDVELNQPERTDCSGWQLDTGYIRHIIDENLNHGLYYVRKILKHGPRCVDCLWNDGCFCART